MSCSGPCNRYLQSLIIIFPSQTISSLGVIILGLFTHLVTLRIVTLFLSGLGKSDTYPHTHHTHYVCARINKYKINNVYHDFIFALLYENKEKSMRETW